MTLLVTRPRRSLAMFPAPQYSAPWGVPAMSGVPVDIEETGDAYLIDLDLPDVAPEDVQIELRDNEIRVFGTSRAKQRTGTLRHQARRTGEFEYLLTLPGDVDAEAVEADLDSGLLSLKARKARGSQARRIEVHGKKASHGEHRDRAGRPPGGTPADTPAAQAKQMKEGQSRPGPASQHVGTTGTGSTGQVGRSSMR